ncbi:MAG: DoxX family protein [Blastomonas sp.]
MIKIVNRAIGLVDNHYFEALALLLARLALAAQFWRSARTKVEDGSFLTISDTTIFLFKEEYGMPAPEITGTIATYAEHVLPVLVLFGLATRFGAAGLFVMTMVIQLFVYPEAWWNPHVMWAGLALVIIARGGGLLSLDRLFDPVWKRS